MDYAAQRKLELETEHAKAVGLMLTAQRETGLGGAITAVLSRNVNFVLWMFATLWLSQILTWGFLMMTFKKDVFPR